MTKEGLVPLSRPPQKVEFAQFKQSTLNYPMETTVLSSPQGENFATPTDPNLFYRLTTAEVIRFRERKFKPSETLLYCYIKTLDPFGHGFRFLPKQIAKVLVDCRQFRY